MPTDEEADRWLREMQELEANREALHEVEAAEKYIGKKKRGKHRLKPPKTKKDLKRYTPTKEEIKYDVYTADRVLQEAQFHPPTPPVCEFMRSGQGRRIIDNQLLRSYKGQPAETKVCESAGDLLEAGKGDQCPRGSRGYVILEAKTRMRDPELQFQKVGLTNDKGVFNYCSIDADNRHMACARVQNTRFDEHIAQGEDMRLNALIRERRIHPRDSFEYRKTRLREQYGVAICEVRL
jgi:hypothetical protein